MKIVNRTALLCNCGGTMPLDGGMIATAAEAAGLCNDGTAAEIHTHLCGAEARIVGKFLAGGERCLIACTQEINRFRRLELEADRPGGIDFVNIREAAGWSSEAANASPKVVALLAAAAVEEQPDEQVSLLSAGHTLVFGHCQAALDTAERLSSRADVTLVIEPGSHVLLPAERQFPILVGTVHKCGGSIGRFTASFNGLAEVLPWARTAADTSPEISRTAIDTDLILDLSGRSPLFPDHVRRLGYARADGNRPEQIERALFDLTGMIGQLSKPRYVAHERSSCVHAAGGKTNCTRCLDICPTGAVTSVDGEIAVDAAICAGCGSCASLCPTGAMTYIAPPTTHTRRRLAVLIGGYLAAGGRRPILLLHSTEKGEQAISALARLGSGLPANVLPMALRRPTSVGLDLMVLALSLGALKVIIQCDPEHVGEAEALERQAAFANDVIERLQGGDERLTVLCSADPEEIFAAVADNAELPELSGASIPDVAATEASLVRDCFERLAAAASPAVEVVSLSPGAAFGRVIVNDACTLCLACTRSCPTAALAGDARTSTFGFIEESCVQCGLCASVCPERAITLEPRIYFGKQAAVPTVLRRDEPAICASCGVRYGSRRTVDGVVARLGVSGWTGQNGDLIERLRLCETCRMKN